jgi:hypothetical protein
MTGALSWRKALSKFWNRCFQRMSCSWYDMTAPGVKIGYKDDDKEEGKGQDMKSIAR